MGGYSKIKDTNNNDPESPLKSPTHFSPDPIKATEPATQEEPIKEEEEEQQQQQEETQKKKSSLEEEEQEEDLKGKLKRNFSTASNRFLKLDRQNSSSIVSSKALQGALRRAFSVRSSSSDKYSRIYSDRPVALASPFEEDGDDEEDINGDAKAGSGKKDAKEKKKHKSSKIIRACKRILGL